MGQKVAQPAGKETAKTVQPPQTAVAEGQKPKLQGREAALLNLQRTHGNRHVKQMLKGGILQRKLTMQGHAQATEIPTIVDQVLNSPGQPLDPETCTFMESRFQQDFSQVRIHTDSRAAESAQAVNANAYTVKQDIAFDMGKYTPASQAGKRLLAHELAHVVQQSRGGGAVPSASAHSPLEQSADQAASALAQGVTSVQVLGASAPGLAREENKEESLSYREKLRRRLAGAYQTVKSVAPPSVQQYLLEPLKEPAKQLIQSAPEEKLRKIEQAVEPALQATEVLGKALPPQTNQQAEPSVDPNKTIWLGRIPLSEQLRRKAEYQKLLADERKDNSVAMPVPPQNPRPSAEDMLGMSSAELTEPDPSPTEFEQRLRSKQPFKHNVLQSLPPQPDLPRSNIQGLPADPRFDWSQVYWLGAAPKLVPNQTQSELTISDENVTPIHDDTTHELKGYRIRSGETIIDLDRNGDILQTTGLEAPLETPVIDPIDVALLAAEVGPIVAKGLAGVGKRLISSSVKRGLRTARAGAARVMLGTSEALPFLEKGAAGATHFDRPTISLLGDIASDTGTKGTLRDVAEIGTEGTGKSTVKTEAGSEAIDLLKAEQKPLGEEGATPTDIAGAEAKTSPNPQRIRAFLRQSGGEVNELTNQYGDRLTARGSGSNRKIDALTGELKPEHIDTGTETSSAARKSAQASHNANLKGDMGNVFDAGHLRGRLLGGKGGLANTFPQWFSINRGLFQLFEGKLADLVRTASKNDKVFFSVQPRYRYASDTAPSQVLYQVRINGQTVVRALFSNEPGRSYLRFIQYGNKSDIF